MFLHRLQTFDFHIRCTYVLFEARWQRANQQCSIYLLLPFGFHMFLPWGVSYVSATAANYFLVTLPQTQKTYPFSNRKSSPQMNILSFFFVSGGVFQRWADFFCFISFGGKTLYIMAIGKRLGITQHVIWPGGSSCHFSLAVAGSHAKGCDSFVFFSLRTHILCPLTALLFSPPAQPKSDQIHATSYCTKTLVRYSKGPPRN